MDRTGWEGPTYKCRAFTIHVSLFPVGNRVFTWCSFAVTPARSEPFYLACPLHFELAWSLQEKVASYQRIKISSLWLLLVFRIRKPSASLAAADLIAKRVGDVGGDLPGIGRFLFTWEKTTNISGDGLEVIAQSVVTMFDRCGIQFVFGYDYFYFKLQFQHGSQILKIRFRPGLTINETALQERNQKPPIKIFI